MPNAPHPDKYPLVVVEWEDSYGCSSFWESLDDMPEVPKRWINTNVGYLTRKTDQLVVLVPHLSGLGDEEPHNGCGDMTIMKSAILRRWSIDYEHLIYHVQRFTDAVGPTAQRGE